MEQPFDARRVMRNDVDQPTFQWRTVSLVTALRAAVAGNVPGLTSDHPQVGDLRNYVDELTSRGIDGDSLVRYGFFRELMSGVLIRALPYRVPVLRTLDSETEGAGTAPPNDTLASDTWAGLLGPLIPVELSVDSPSDATFEILRPLFSRLADKVYPWVLTASVDDLLILRPPTAEQLNAVVPPSRPDMATMREYRWTSDRFAVTHLDHWSTSSLLREYNWRAGKHPPPCPEALMDDRSVVAEDLNAEIARRSAGTEPTARIGGHVGLGHALLDRLRSNAIQFLMLNRTREAAALFEFAVNENPHDSELVNNLGFCLIPHDPRKALTRLEEAARLGYPLAEINLHNRALCKLMLGEHRAALDMICSQWSQIRGESAMLWRQGSQGLRLQSSTTSRDELAHLAHRAAIFLGDRAAVRHWARLAGIPVSPD